GPPEDEVSPAAAWDLVRAAAPSGEPDAARRLDVFAVNALSALRTRHRPDLEAIYLPGLDIATMRALDDAALPHLSGPDPRLESVRAHYRAVDVHLAALTADAGPETVVIVVADPGRLPRRAGNPEGLLVMVGGPTIAADAGHVAERDVAPTALHLLG